MYDKKYAKLMTTVFGDCSISDDLLTVRPARPGETRQMRRAAERREKKFQDAKEKLRARATKGG